MSYKNNVVWRVVPQESFKVIRNCSKCGCKSTYMNTGNFRVNANGKFLDVWLIYQCEKCKNTLNIEIYERINPNKIPQIEYQKFLINDKERAFYYGTSKELFRNNKAEIDSENMKYKVIETVKASIVRNCAEKTIMIENPYSLKIRLDKVIAGQLEISRTQVKKLMEEGVISHNQGNAFKKGFIIDGMELTIVSLNY